MALIFCWRYANDGLIFLILLFASQAKSQSYYNNGNTCDFILVQGDTALITAFNGLDKKDFGIYLGVKYSGLFSGSIFYTPFNAINRLGISKGYLNDGFRVSAGVKMTPIGTTNYSIVPEFGVQFHPIRFISKDRYSFDIVLAYYQSTTTRVGFGISFPIQYRNNFRL